MWLIASFFSPAILPRCAFHGFVYAGVQFGEQCWCGNSLDRTAGAGAPLDASSCNVPCVGDSTSLCGGSWAITLYNRTLPSSPYTKATIHAGSSFFSGWSFFTSQDPTDGNVTYVSKSTATSNNLAYVQSNGNVVIKVDNTTTLPVGTNRKSVRISTSATYTTALMIFDVLHMPWGCSVRLAPLYARHLWIFLSFTGLGLACYLDSTLIAEPDSCLLTTSLTEGKK